MNQKEMDIYFLREAFKTARDLSQDANSQTGAKIVDIYGNEISSGQIEFILDYLKDTKEKEKEFYLADLENILT